MILSIILAAFVMYKGKRVLESNVPHTEYLLLQNVEALSQDESGKKKYTCYSTITEKDGCMVRYCQTCEYIPGTDTWYAPSHKCSK